MKNIKLVYIAVLALVAAACTTVQGVPPPAANEPPPHAIEVVALPATLPATPPAGQCHLWLPHLPPAQQVPPGPCTTVASEVPAGGWLIYWAAPDAVAITAYSTHRVGLVGEVGFYDPGTGARLHAPPPLVAGPPHDLGVPPERLPPLGGCEIWYPGQPLSHQPPLGRCDVLNLRVPPGAWLLYRTAPEQVVVTAYHPETGLAMWVSAYNVALVPPPPPVVGPPPPVVGPPPPPVAGPPHDLGVPPGHLPPPGSCKIWYPERPPGHQPPPGDCRVLAQQVPAGAWLLDRTAPGQVVVTAYHPDGSVWWVRPYSVNP